MTNLVTANSINWNYSVPTTNSDKYFLLTIGGVATTGPWTGEYMQYFKAWAPLMKENKRIEHWISIQGREYLSKVKSISAWIEHDNEFLFVEFKDGTTLRIEGY
jgi:hypothetical protein